MIQAQHEDSVKATQRRVSWRSIGPGIVVAATGIGAGDLVATLIAGARYGHALLWAAVAGCLVKIVLAEAVGRWHLATGLSLFEGWSQLGRWTRVYFAPYIVIWGFVYGATAMSATALPLSVLMPAVPFTAWAILAGLSALAFVWFNRYAALERVMVILVGVMFVTVPTLAVLLAPSLPDVLAGLTFSLPSGSVLYTLGLVGGVGGTITMAAYGYWVEAKGWRDAGWMRMMRVDNGTGYVVTGVFVISMLIVGASLLHETGIALAGGTRGLIDLADVLTMRLGATVSTLFLIGFAATAFSSVLGVWHGVSMLFADFVDHTRGRPARSPDARAASPAFRGYLLWLTFPPILLVTIGRPFQLVLAYGALGALFMPFLALTLLWLLNSSRTPPGWRNGWISNVGLALAALLFLVVSGYELIGLLW